MFDKIGGLKKLAELAGNPHQLPSIVAASLPGATHCLGRMRLYGEIAGHAALLNMHAHRMIATALLQKRDITPQEGAMLDGMELQLLTVAKILNKFPGKAEGMNLDTLTAAYGVVPQSNGATPPQEGNGHDKEAGSAGASAA